jgi:DNA-binding GntR family transcriptional regulator
MDITTSKGDKELLAYNYIKERIQNKTFPPGTQLSEQKLSSALNGMSRTPIKDALRRLIVEGLIEKHERGMIVSKVDFQDLIEISELRTWIEQGTVQLFLERTTNDKIKELGQILASHEHALHNDDFRRADELDTQFHLFIAKNSYNTHAYDFLVKLTEEYTRGSYDIRDDKKLLENSLSEHQAIYNALAKSDIDLAQKLMSEHLSHCIEYFKEKRLNEYFLFKD